MKLDRRNQPVPTSREVGPDSAHITDVVGALLPQLLESKLKFAIGVFRVTVMLGVVGLLQLAYEYSFGTGYGLHPGLAGMCMAVLVGAWIVVDGLVESIQ